MEKGKRWLQVQHALFLVVTIKRIIQNCWHHLTYHPCIKKMKMSESTIIMSILTVCKHTELSCRWSWWLLKIIYLVSVPAQNVDYHLKFFFLFQCSITTSAVKWGKSSIMKSQTTWGCENSELHLVFNPKLFWTFLSNASSSSIS